MKHVQQTLLCCGFLVAGALASPVLAADVDDDRFFIEPGMFEFSLSGIGSWSQQENSVSQTITAGGDVRLGYFLTRWFELGARLEYLYREVEIEQPGTDTETETHNLLAGPELILNVPTTTAFSPYIVGGGGVVYSDFKVNNDSVSDSLGGYWEAGGGMRFFLSEWAALNLRVTFLQLLLEDEGDIDSVIGSIGFSVYFGH